MMKKQILSALAMTAIAGLSEAQTKRLTENDPALKAKDSVITATIIKPAIDAADEDEPNWDSLSKVITGKYDATFADRTLTAAEIRWYWNKDWPKFSEKIVHYTENYEEADDDLVLDHNAKFILRFSNRKEELEKAAAWAKTAVRLKPGKAAYQQTLDALNEKLSHL